MTKKKVEIVETPNLENEADGGAGGNTVELTVTPELEVVLTSSISGPETPKMAPTRPYRRGSMRHLYNRNVLYLFQKAFGNMGDQVALDQGLDLADLGAYYDGPEVGELHLDSVQRERLQSLL